MAGVDGSWAISIQTPMGERKGTLVVDSSGDSFTGSFSNDQGSSEITDGAVCGDTLRCSFDVTRPMQLTLQLEATVSGDAISGALKIPGFGDCPMTGSRA